MFLVFDTETTGLPRNYNASVSDLDNWPRVVQLAWQLHDEHGKLIEVKNFIIKPEGFTIPYNAEKVHGISTERAQRMGVPISQALEAFTEALAKTTFLAGHNILFDINILGAEYYRLFQKTPLQAYSYIDTVTVSTDFCALPGGKGGKFKWPNLSELHLKLFGEAFGEAHNAAADVEATARCFLELIRLQVIAPETIRFSQEQLHRFLTYNQGPVKAIGLNTQPYEPMPTEELKPVSESKEIELTPVASEIDHLPFMHLHGHSKYSVLQSTASIEGIIAKSKELGMEAVALTDLANMYGVFSFVKQATKAGIKPLVGCEFFLAKNHLNKDLKDHFVQDIFIAKNEKGYKNLAKLCSLAHTAGFYYVPRIDKSLIQQYASDMIVISGNISGSVSNLLLNVGYHQAEQELLWWKEHFKDDFYLELCRHGLDDEQVVNKSLLELAEKHQVKVVATNNFYYLDQKDAEAHDVLLCIKEGEKQSTPIGRGRGYRYGFANDQYYFKSAAEMKVLFSDIPQAIEAISEITQKVEFFKLERDVLLPAFQIPDAFKSEDDYLRHLTYQGAEKRYPELTSEIRERLDFELGVIQKTGYPGYFLIVQDFTNEARKMGVSVGPGRGSAAGSAVAYCIGITNVDPIKYDLLFERFLNPDRVSLPDIDIDFDDVGRGKVIDYVIQKYGKSQVAQIITYGTMAAKSSIRDAGRVLDLPLSDTDRLAKLIPESPGVSLSDAFSEVKELAEIKKKENLEGKTLRQAEILEGSLRNTGTHACGVIITPRDISDLIPVTISKDSDLLVTQFDNSVVESAGLLKMDFLGLKTLTIIKDAIEIIQGLHGIDIDPDHIPLDDLKTYQLYQRGETNGTFQFESAGMQKYLRQLKPDAFDDLIAMNALYRPGPLEYIPNFIARKHGREPIVYDLPDMEEYLKGTYGITVYQEQVMLLSQKLANFTKGQADLLRKAMGKKIRAQLDELKPKFIEGCAANGHPKDKSEKIWKDWEAFAEYAFNKSHSTCYSVVAFQTAYLKANYPAEYMAAVLTNNMGDIKKVTFFMEECKRMGLKVLGPDVNESYYKFAVNKKGEVRFGLGAIKGVGEGAVLSIIQNRKEKGAYSSVFDLARRIDLRSANKKTFESLALAGAFDSFQGVHRAQFFYEENGSLFLEKVLKYGNGMQNQQSSSQSSLFGEDIQSSMSEPPMPKIEPWSALEKLSKEKEVVGVYISGHPLQDFDVEMKHFCSTNATELKDLARFKDKEITIAGIVTESSHRVSKNGKPFGTFTLEDYNDSVSFFLFSQDYIQFKNFLNTGWFLYVRAKVVPKMFNEQELELKILQVDLLQNIRQKLAQLFTIKLTSEELSESQVQDLQEIFSKHKGSSKVKFLIESEQEQLQVLMFSRNTSVSIDNELLQALEQRKIPFKIN